MKAKSACPAASSGTGEGGPPTAEKVGGLAEAEPIKQHTENSYMN